MGMVLVANCWLEIRILSEGAVKVASLGKETLRMTTFNTPIGDSALMREGTLGCGPQPIVIRLFSAEQTGTQNYYQDNKITQWEEGCWKVQSRGKLFLLYFLRITRALKLRVIFYFSNLMLNREEKKVLSSSFSKQSPTITLEKSNSFSADKLTSSKSQERGAEKNIVAKVIEGLNSSKDKSSEVDWHLNSFDEKRSISGFKGRIEWHSKLKDMRIILKISFASSYFRLINHLNQGDIFVEIEELNFVLSNQEKKQLQERIEKILANSIESTKRKAYNDEAKKQSQCLKLFLQEVNNQLQKKVYEGKKKSNERVDKNLSKKYMLYPAPSAFAWNPLGGICITENKYPAHKKTFYGQPNALRKYFQTSRHETGFSLREEENNLEINKESNNYENIYDWKIQEQVELLIFNKQKSFKKEDRFYVNRTKNELQSQSKREEQKKDEEGVLLAYLNRLPSNKLRKLYERYFGGGERTSQFHRHDKLRVYQVRSFNRDHQDDIVYIFEKIAATSEKDRLQALFQNDLSAYPSLLQEMNSIKYKLLGNILIRNLADPKIHFCTFLKIFILQNQFLGLEIQRYFKQMYRIINRMPHHLLFFIGSYNHFDQGKSELLFMDLLDKVLDINERELCSKVEGLQDGVKIKVNRKVRLPNFHYESIVSQQEKNNFLMKLFPLLIVKDREMEKFQFKQIKRIITANAKLFLFIRKINEIITKLEEGRFVFLRSMIDGFKKFREGQEEEDLMRLQPRRMFYVHCRFCRKASKIYELAAKEEIEYCTKCKQKVVAESI